VFSSSGAGNAWRGHWFDHPEVRPEVMIHPDDAAERRIANGDLVMLGK
jgi:anaerobic selenocysteine-containing dehydrogenase